MKKNRLMMILLAMTIFLAACGNGGDSEGSESDGASEESEVKQIIIASGPIGGGWYNTAAGMAEILMREIPGLNVTVNEGGGYDNLRLVNKGDAQIGYAFTNDVMTAISGTDTFEEEGSLDNVKAFLSLYPSHLQTVVLEKSGIKSYKDLGDKRLLPGQASWTTIAHIEEILSQFDYSFESIRENGGNVSNTGYSDMPGLLKDGHADVAMGTTAVPAGWVMELDAQDKISLVGLEPEIQDHMVERYPGIMKMTIPKGAYKGVKEDVPTIGSYTNLVFNSELSDEFVYKVTKAVMDNIDELKAVDSVLDDFTIEDMLIGLDEENVHPGVLKYLEENK